MIALVHKKNIKVERHALISIRENTIEINIVLEKTRT